MPRINTTTGAHPNGIGDMVMLSWLAEGTRDTDDPVSFYAKPGKMHHTILKMFGQEIVDDPANPGVLLSQGYPIELKDGGRRRRIDYYRDMLGVSAPCKRPTATIPPDALEWAERTKLDQGDRPLVLLFPQMVYESRAWPPYHWLDLAWALRERNIAVLALLAHEDKRFKDMPVYLWGYDLNRIAALMSLATLVIGNDSGPAHLSGTLGTRTLVMGGPTRAECVYGHLPDVAVLTSDEEPHCVGCHFRPPYRVACDFGCQALANLKPLVVFRRAISELVLAASRPKPGSRRKFEAVNERPLVRGS